MRDFVFQKKEKKNSRIYKGVFLERTSSVEIVALESQEQAQCVEALLKDKSLKVDVMDVLFVEKIQAF